MLAVCKHVYLYLVVWNCSMGIFLSFLFTRCEKGLTFCENKCRSEDIAMKNLNTPTGRLLSLKQAADYSGITIWGLRTIIWNGLIPIVRFGSRKIYIDVKDLEKLIERNKETIL